MDGAFVVFGVVTFGSSIFGSVTLITRVVPTGTLLVGSSFFFSVTTTPVVPVLRVVVPFVSLCFSFFRAVTVVPVPPVRGASADFVVFVDVSSRRAVTVVPVVPVRRPLSDRVASVPLDRFVSRCPTIRMLSSVLRDPTVGVSTLSWVSSVATSSFVSDSSLMTMTGVVGRSVDPSS